MKRSVAKDFYVEEIEPSNKLYVSVAMACIEEHSVYTKYV